jgi:hypothetical protein
MISDDYYDLETYNLLFDTLTEEDRECIENTKESKGIFLFKRWRMIVNSLPANYYNQYQSNRSQSDRNAWFKKYLDYPTKDISQMPEIL